MPMTRRRLEPPAGFRLVREGKVVALVRERDADWLIRAGLLDPERLLRERGSHRGGRGPVARIAGGPAGALVLKKYRRGGFAGRVLPDLFAGAGRMLADLRASERARAGGVATPAVLALVLIRREGPLLSAWLASEEIEGAEPLAIALARAAAQPGRIPGEGLPSPHPREGAPGERMPRSRARALAELAVVAIRSLHDAGIVHRDLNLGNLLVRGEQISILDLDGAAILDSVPAVRRFSNLSRLDRSYLKLFGEEGALSHEDRRALLRVYCADDAALRRDFESRIAAHKRSLWRHRLLW